MTLRRITCCTCAGLHKVYVSSTTLLYFTDPSRAAVVDYSSRLRTTRNSDLSNFIEPFPCGLSAQNFQTKYSTLNETGEMNHASKQKDLSYFHFNVRSLGKNKHKLDDFFLMTEANPTFIAISETKLKSNCNLNVDIPTFNFIHNLHKPIQVE